MLQPVREALNKSKVIVAWQSSRESQSGLTDRWSGYRYGMRRKQSRSRYRNRSPTTDPQQWSDTTCAEWHPAALRALTPDKSRRSTPIHYTRSFSAVNVTRNDASGRREYFTFLSYRCDTLINIQLTKIWIKHIQLVKKGLWYIPHNLRLVKMLFIRVDPQNKMQVASSWCKYSISY